MFMLSAIRVPIRFPSKDTKQAQSKQAFNQPQGIGIQYEKHRHRDRVSCPNGQKMWPGAETNCHTVRSRSDAI